MTLDYTFLSLYWAIGPLAWLAYGYLIYNGRRKMLLMRRPPVPMKVQAPSVTIVIPAKDEGERIGGCVESALNQDYPNFDVLAIDDRSADDTGAVMDAMRDTNPKLSVLHVQQETLQPGWTGKNNALYQGQKQAGGRWLLFVDSDVVLEPDALSCAMSVVINRNYDLLSLLPALESHTIWEGLLVPLAGSAASTMYVVPLTNANRRPQTAFANGQFLLISRDAYDKMGTHEVVKDRYCEDIEIARLVKRMGLRPRVSWGREWARVRMYSSLANIIKGWSRIYYAARVGSPWRMLAAIAFIVVCCYSIFPATAWTTWRLAHPVDSWSHLAWLGGVVVHALATVAFIGVMYAWTGNPRRYAWVWPITLVMLLGILFRALWMCVTKKVEWRGTSYGHTMTTQLTVPSPGQK
jgi:chlorobactene glucosyltransferase